MWAYIYARGSKRLIMSKESKSRVPMILNVISADGRTSTKPTREDAAGESGGHHCS